MNPTDKRYVTICPANERTVRYKQLRAIDGRKSLWRKYSIRFARMERNDVVGQSGDQAVVAELETSSSKESLALA